MLGVKAPTHWLQLRFKVISNSLCRIVSESKQLLIATSGGCRKMTWCSVWSWIEPALFYVALCFDPIIPFLFHLFCRSDCKPTNIKFLLWKFTLRKLDRLLQLLSCVSLVWRAVHDTASMHMGWTQTETFIDTECLSIHSRSVTPDVHFALTGWADRFSSALFLLSRIAAHIRFFLFSFEKV